MEGGRNARCGHLQVIEIATDRMGFAVIVVGGRRDLLARIRRMD